MSQPLDGGGYVSGMKCQQERKKNHVFIPAPHQQFVTDYFTEKSIYKGILLYHKLGSGKSCTSIMIADKLLAMNKVKKVFVLTPGSLRKNWVSEYCRVCGSMKSMDKFIFITYNYDISPRLKEFDFNDSLIIIDEAHNLLNGYKNESKNATALYTKVRDSKCRVVALSGTPLIQNNILTEWINLSRLLDEGRSSHIRSLQNLSDEYFKGIISYYPGDPTKYPNVIVKAIQAIPMTEKQYEIYTNVYRNEKKARAMPPEPGLRFSNPIEYAYLLQVYIMAKKYLMSRMVSNCLYEGANLQRHSHIDSDSDSDNDNDSDSENDSENDTDVILNIKAKSHKKIIKDEEDIIDVKDDKLPDKMVEDGGWITNDLNLLKMSPKISRLLWNIINHIDEKHVIYSFYKSRSGVQLIQTLLNHCGKKYGINAEVYSGDVSDKKREIMLDKFNSEENRGGKLIKVLLITDAGSEGITVLECNNIHVLESNTRENKTRQAIGRVIRYKSHEKLPKEQQFVNVWRYWSVVPKTENNVKPLVDEELYKAGKMSEKMFDTFTQKIIENCIESGVPYMSSAPHDG